jgi:hypothetical protein
MPKPRSRIVYIENKSEGLDGPACISRVTFSRSGKAILWNGRELHSLAGRGFKANYFDVRTGERFWISGPRKDGADHLYAPAGAPIPVDVDVREEYWTKIRGKSEDCGPTTGGTGRG